MKIIKEHIWRYIATRFYEKLKSQVHYDNMPQLTPIFRIHRRFQRMLDIVLWSRLRRGYK